MRYMIALLTSLYISLSALAQTTVVRNTDLTAQAVLVTAQKSIFPQHRVANCSAGEGAPETQRFGHFSLTVRPEGDIRLQGTDLLGIPWSASLETAPVARCEVWQGDFSGNGQGDLAILSFGTDSSGGWDTTLSLLLFDRDGRPFPWQATGDFHLTGSGIKEIVSLKGQIAATVIVPQREGERVAGYGYAYSAVQVANERMVKINTASWPLFIAPTTALQTHQHANTLSTDTTHADPPGRLASLAGYTDDTRRLITSSGRAIRPSSILMDDSISGVRSIFFSPQSPDWTRLVNQKANVQPFGTSCQGEECQPLLLWATP